jgi:hypothetical protein
MALPGGHPLAVGAAVPSPPFPATVADLQGLSHAQISALSVVYNDTFGIVAADGLVQRRGKVSNWLQGL